jgi:hypothetical protein
MPPRHPSSRCALWAGASPNRPLRGLRRSKQLLGGEPSGCDGPSKNPYEQRSFKKGLRSQRFPPAVSMGLSYTEIQV